MSGAYWNLKQERPPSFTPRSKNGLLLISDPAEKARLQTSAGVGAWTLPDSERTECPEHLPRSILPPPCASPASLRAAVSVASQGGAVEAAGALGMSGFADTLQPGQALPGVTVPLW